MSGVTVTRDHPSGARLIGVLGLVAALSGLIIVSVYRWALPVITEQRQAALDAAAMRLIPGATRIEPLSLQRSGTERGPAIYVGYDAAGRPVGYVAEGAARGYADTIRLLYSYSPSCECIVGMAILSSRETPGFGDKLETDPAFVANFEALDARLNDERKALAHPIVTVKHGTKSEPWQIDAISGATVSSRAVGKAINESAQRLIPLLPSEPSR